ncbi:MAG: hypothetical protein CME62_07745 [Halobacteriovoraceae bacterium]|nr:hypothetical protein [Halobacteriovoraceae bacterium]|tara:strand:+ start:179 stop:700 length:522 start_codon:yes stop_codon:yes gene_type:complete
MKLLSLMILIVQVGFAQDHKHHGQKMKSEKKEMNHSAHAHGVENKQFNKVLSEYESLHQAFFDEKLEKTKTQAKSVSAAISEIKDPEILKLLTYTQKKLTELQNSTDLDKSKEAMNVVSQGILNVLEKHAPNKHYARYYCPMVKKYWIQNIKDSEKVMNPYASTSMPHCGSKK